MNLPDETNNENVRDTDASKWKIGVLFCALVLIGIYCNTLDPPGLTIDHLSAHGVGVTAIQLFMAGIAAFIYSKIGNHWEIAFVISYLLTFLWTFADFMTPRLAAN